MTLQAINKFKEPDATPLGHLDHVRKNIQSTKTKDKFVEDEFDAVINAHLEVKTNDFFHKIIDLKDTMCTE